MLDVKKLLTFMTECAASIEEQEGLVAEKRKLESELADAKLAHSTVTDSLTHAAGTVQRLTKTCAGLVDRNDALISKIKALQETYDGLSKKNLELNERCVALERANADLCAKVARSKEDATDDQI